MVHRPNIQLARHLRQIANAPERKAWQTLRILRAEGFPVCRQHPIGPYIVDFAITKARLVIEVDGGIHDRPDVKARDEAREVYLENLGWRVLRVRTDVAASPDHLMTEVRAQLPV